MPAVAGENSKFGAPDYGFVRLKALVGTQVSELAPKGRRRSGAHQMRAISQRSEKRSESPELEKMSSIHKMCREREV